MENSKKQGIGFFEKYLTIWVLLCMAVGVLIGKFLPAVPDFLGRFEYAQVSIPIAILIWLMIFPMMLKVDFKSIKNVGKNPKGLFVTWVTNWLIKPFTMFGIASLFFFVIFKALIPGFGKGIFSRSDPARSRPLYGDGVCMEPSYQRRPRLYGSTSGDQRPYHPCSIYTDCCVSARCWRRFYPVGHITSFCRSVRCNTACRRHHHTDTTYQAKR